MWQKNEATGHTQPILRIAPGWDKEAAHGDDVPDGFYCPISRRVMMDPVMTAVCTPLPCPARPVILTVAAPA